MASIVRVVTVLLVIYMVSVLGKTTKKRDADEDVTRIIEGWPAASNKFPNYVALLDSNNYVCGGGLINPKYILTAAHCIDGDSKYPTDAMLGADNVKLSGDGKRYSIIRWIRHENYKSTTLQNDIGLLKTSRTIEYSSQYLGLARETSNIGTYLMVAGWDATSAGRNNSSNLRNLKVKIISNAECKNQWPQYNVFTTNLCTLSRKGEGLCTGDSGSVLVRNGMIEGIVSWVPVMCGNGLTDVHTRVADYYDWIRARID